MVLQLVSRAAAKPKIVAANDEVTEGEETNSPGTVHATIESMTANFTDMTPSFMQHNYGLPQVQYQVPGGMRRSRSSRLTTSDLKSWMATDSIPRDGLLEATREAGELLQLSTQARLRREEVELR